MKQHLVIIHGGTTFETYEEYMRYLESCTVTLESFAHKDWKNGLREMLPQFEIVYPKMPNKQNARYREWKVWFEKIVPLLSDSVVLVGHSLGGLFLAKYLSENEFPKKISQLHLVAAPYDTEVIKDSLVDFALTNTVESLAQKADAIFLYQSKDDTDVAYEDVLKYKRDLPEAELVVFESRGHFRQATFPELVANVERV